MRASVLSHAVGTLSYVVFAGTIAPRRTRRARRKRRSCRNLLFQVESSLFLAFVRFVENTLWWRTFRHTRDSKACPRESGGGYPGSSGWGKNLDSRLRGNDDQERQWRKALFSFFVGVRKLMNHFVVKSATFYSATFSRDANVW